MAQPIAVAIHGGAGNLTPHTLPTSKVQEHEAYLKSVVEEAYHLLEEGRLALEVVEIAVRRLEDAGYFNAGRGAVLNEKGFVQLDASIMDGKTRRSGAVAAVRATGNPVTLARLVMERTNHVLIVGEGADSLAKLWALPPLRNDYIPHASPVWTQGTVGAVALDKYGNLAAATSTGGIVGKKVGRVGDSPIIGAGTYAENGLIALSATGHGEYFIRSVLAYDIAARLRYAKASPAQAIEEAFKDRLESIGGTGGVIAVTPKGEVLFYFNTPGMYRAGKDAQGRLIVATFR
ncbi:MAG: isoaspartyl peptidase/L-asparaginase [Bacteroidia bacterium]|nr:isoaspartyl peptidase/L-asparaginase [Bacteroidia bacterium]MDW8057165.1 isoaspartyl peptidase/L-asparaginase [Bacteroidia bacterium]